MKIDGVSAANQDSSVMSVQVLLLDGLGLVVEEAVTLSCPGYRLHQHTKRQTQEVPKMKISYGFNRRTWKECLHNLLALLRVSLGQGCATGLGRVRSIVCLVGEWALLLFVYSPHWCRAA